MASEEKGNGDEIGDELQDTVAYSLIDDAWRLLKINDAEKKFFQLKYRELYEVVHGLKKQEELVVKEIKKAENETLAEKICLDKTLIEEQEETSTLRKLEEARANLVKELEYTEAKDTMVKFELEELKTLHEELTDAFAAMKKKNADTVEPVLAKLRRDNDNLVSEIQNADEAFERETKQKQMLVARLEEVEKIRDGKDLDIEGKQTALKSAESEPTRLLRQVDAVERAAKLMDTENKAMIRKFKAFDLEIAQQASRREEAERVKKSMDEKLELNMRTIEKREQDVAIVQSNLDAVQATGHDLLTTRAELNDAKRILKKKTAFTLGMRSMIPTLEEQLRGVQLQLKTLSSEKNVKSREVIKLKEEVDSFIADFLQQEGLESGKKQELERAVMEVDEAEAKVMQALAETKKQAKLLSEKEARSAVKIKELNILDLTKRCTEISNRLKEFTALYDVVKNERNKYVSLLQGSTQATAEIKEKIRILNNEVEILGNESQAKDAALVKENEYRAKQGQVEQQIMEIDKLNVVINNLEKDMLDLKGKYEKSVEERNITGVQLIDRNDELCILYERSNQQTDSLKKGELELIKKDWEFRQLRLQTEELKRQYVAAKHRLPERDKIDDLSAKLEDPANGDRWRALEGDDPSTEQLLAKISILEDRLDQKREVLLEKELVLEEITNLTERLRKQAMNKRDSAKTSREKILEEAKWKLDHGEPPTDDAVKTWNRNERKRLANIETAIHDMGIPKPYGRSAPFKPTEAGSTMRHIKMVNPKAIEI
eukprot:GSChrysophyteH1.ASY1.ANO1.962.1 assembled CDS